MINENFSNMKVHEIVGRAKLSKELLEELLKHDVKRFHSAEVDFEAGEIVLDTFTIIYED